MDRNIRRLGSRGNPQGVWDCGDELNSTQVFNMLTLDMT